MSCTVLIPFIVQCTNGFPFATFYLFHSKINGNDITSVQVNKCTLTVKMMNGKKINRPDT